MHVFTGKWNRRNFLQAGAGAAALAVAHRGAAAALTTRPRFALASANGLLRSYRVNDRSWQPIEALPMPTAGRAPAHLVMHPTLPVVYVCHDVALWDYLPRGAVSAYRLDTATGALRLLGTQPLSLGATHAQNGTVTTGGRSLIALTQSGIVNVLPLAMDGELLPVAAIRKEYGRTAVTSSNTPAPMHAVHHPDGSLLAVDPGQGTLLRFRLQADAVVAQQRLPVHGAAGARQVTLSRCGRWAYALHAQNASISTHSVTKDAIHPAHQLLPGAAGWASLVPLPNSDFLLRAEQGTVSLLLVDRHTGELSKSSSTAAGRMNGLRGTPDSTAIVGFDPDSGVVTAVPVYAASGRLGASRRLATIAGCTGLALYLA